MCGVRDGLVTPDQQQHDNSQDTRVWSKNQCFGSGLYPDSIRSVDPDLDSEFADPERQNFPT